MELNRTATAKEIAAYYRISVRTLQRRLRPFKQFFEKNKRKSFYLPDEIDFIKKLFRDTKRQE
jgi:hypothetical protein